MGSTRAQLSLDELEAGIAKADRSILGRAITLMESSRPEDTERANELLTRIIPKTGQALRVGITGVPGVGKSTFIETLGCLLTSRGHRVAVLAVDPSSTRSGGSILGDKTRMDRLSVDPNAFVRPSPTSGTLGGVAAKTRETMLLCEAAGFDIILVETVGVGQSELMVAEMTDFFLVLMLAGAGDELQGIKRGLMELADMLVVNKADGENAANAARAAGQNIGPIAREHTTKERAHQAARTYANAVRYLHPADAPWLPPVLTCSALENEGIDEVWQKVESYRDTMTEAGLFGERRREQRLNWLWSIVNTRVREDLAKHPALQSTVAKLENDVQAATLAPTTAANEILEAFYRLMASDTEQ